MPSFHLCLSFMAQALRWLMNDNSLIVNVKSYCHSAVRDCTNNTRRVLKTLRMARIARPHPKDPESLNHSIKLRQSDLCVAVILVLHRLAPSLNPVLHPQMLIRLPPLHSAQTWVLSPRSPHETADIIWLYLVFESYLRINVK